MSALKALKSLLKSASGFAQKDSIKSFAKENPFATFGLLAPTAAFLAEDIASPLTGGFARGSGLDRIGMPSVEEQAKREMESLQGLTSDRLKTARIEEMVQRNIAAIERMSPHMHNQILAGRILPQGAVVLGGNPRTDLLEEVAYNMGTSESLDEFSSLIQ